MFTGIVETLGRVTSIDNRADSARIAIFGPEVLDDVTHGASISVNGVCLTVVDFDSEVFTADVMRETLNRSTLGTMNVGEPVNLERAMPANGRLGGHIVQGHVDARGSVLEVVEEPDWTTMRISVPRDIAPFIVEKGSITVSGVSLTVVNVSEPKSTAQEFSISLIPTTFRETSMGALKVGDSVNIEVDALAKYVQRLMAFNQLENL
jgi:riboflavin synthase